MTLRVDIVSMWLNGRDTADIARILNQPESVVYNALANSRGHVEDRRVIAQTDFIDSGGIDKVPNALWFHPKLLAPAKTFFAFMAQSGREPMPVSEVFHTVAGIRMAANWRRHFDDLIDNGFIIRSTERFVGDDLVRNIYSLAAGFEGKT